MNPYTTHSVALYLAGMFYLFGLLDGILSFALVVFILLSFIFMFSLPLVNLFEKSPNRSKIWSTMQADAPSDMKHLKHLSREINALSLEFVVLGTFLHT